MTAKVLYLDCETSPIVAHIWSLRDLHVGLNQIVQDPEIIGVGYKWEGGPTRYVSTWDEGGREGMLKTVHALLDECDVAVHYNGNGFDIPWLSGEFARIGLTPPSPFKNIDLYRVARKAFRFPSHKLQYVSTALGLPGKQETGGHGLWVACLAGDEKARRKMGRYCMQDVRLLPDLLKKLLAYLPANINIAYLGGTTGLACPACESTHLQQRGFARTASRSYRRYQCQDCGKWSKDSRMDRDQPTADLQGEAR